MDFALLENYKISNYCLALEEKQKKMCVCVFCSLLELLESYFDLQSEMHLLKCFAIGCLLMKHLDFLCVDTLGCLPLDKIDNCPIIWLKNYVLATNLFARNVCCYFFFAFCFTHKFDQREEKKAAHTTVMYDYKKKYVNRFTFFFFASFLFRCS